MNYWKEISSVWPSDVIVSHFFSLRTKPSSVPWAITKVISAATTAAKLSRVLSSMYAIFN